MHPAITVLIVAGLLLMATIVFLIAYSQKEKKTKRTTQRLITDEQLLRLIAEQPDGILSAKQLAAKTELTKREAGTRLRELYRNGLLHPNVTTTREFYYRLMNPIEEKEIPALSPEPFLTVDDILQLFQTFDFQLDLQKLIIATGLPVRILLREMKYFKEQKIIKMLMSSNGAGIPVTKTYYLEEPYRSNPEQFLSRAKEMNASLKELLTEDLLV